MVLIAIAVCAVGLGLLVYRYDIYEREPWHMLLLAGGLGVGGYWILSYGEDALLSMLPGGTSLFWQSAVAGICEEMCKLLIVVGIALLIPSHFNDPFDGLIYGAMAGLGFALGEAAFYLELMGAQVAWYSAIAQEIVRLILHMLMGALSCVGLGLAHFRVPRWPLLICGSVAASMTIHFAWDYFCGLPAATPESGIQQRTIAVALMLTALLLFGIAVVTASRHSGDTHPVNKLRDLWGWPFSIVKKRRKR